MFRDLTISDYIFPINSRFDPITGRCSSSEFSQMCATHNHPYHNLIPLRNNLINGAVLIRKSGIQHNSHLFKAIHGVRLIGVIDIICGQYTLDTVKLLLVDSKRLR